MRELILVCPECRYRHRDHEPCHLEAPNNPPGWWDVRLARALDGAAGDNSLTPHPPHGLETVAAGSAPGAALETLAGRVEALEQQQTLTAQATAARREQGDQLREEVREAMSGMAGRVTAKRVLSRLNREQLPSIRRVQELLLGIKRGSE